MRAHSFVNTQALTKGGVQALGQVGGQLGAERFGCRHQAAAAALAAAAVVGRRHRCAGVGSPELVQHLCQQLQEPPLLCAQVSPLLQVKHRRRLTVAADQHHIAAQLPPPPPLNQLLPQRLILLALKLGVAGQQLRQHDEPAAGLGAVKAPAGRREGVE